MKKPTFKPTALSKTVAISNMIVGVLASLSIVTITILSIVDNFEEEDHPIINVLILAGILYFFLGIANFIAGIQAYKGEEKGIHRNLLFGAIFLAPFISGTLISMFDHDLPLAILIPTLFLASLVVLDGIVLKRINQEKVKSKKS